MVSYVSTIATWPNSAISKCAYRYCTCHLGFDPIGSVYKLLKICPVFEIFDEEEDYLDHADDFTEGNFNLRSIECEILTLGVDSSWRSIHPQPNGIIPHGICVDGVLYWMTVVPGMRPGHYQLYSFNLTGEKFQSIDHPIYHDSRSDLRLLQSGTRPMLGQFGRYKNQLSIMKTHYRESSWTEMNVYPIHPGSIQPVHLNVPEMLPMDVRKTIMLSLPPSNATLAPILDCTLDVGKSVCRAVYCVLASKFLLQSLSIKLRALILQRGLSDRSTAVVECFKLMKDEWLVKFCCGDPIERLKFHDVETYVAVGDSVMGALHKAGSVKLEAGQGLLAVPSIT